MTLRIAIAGAAHPHAAYVTAEIDRYDDFQLVGVADPDRAVAERYAAPYRARVFADHRELLEATHPDVVMVAGIYADRGRTVVDTLDAGAHVLSDKPLCTSLSDLTAIAEAAHRNSRYVVLLLEKRYYPETLAAIELVRAGELGTIHGIVSSGPHKLNRPSRPEWFFDCNRYGGLLNDLAVHDIDAALYFTGLTAGTVSGALAGEPAFPRYGTATLTGPGVLITAGVDWLTPAAAPLHGDYRMKLTGTEGTAELQWARHRLILTTTSKAPYDVPLPTGYRPAELPLQALADGKEPEVSTSQSLLVTRLALLAQQSAESDNLPLPWTS